jgi:hypothetical protein
MRLDSNSRRIHFFTAMYCATVLLVITFSAAAVAASQVTFVKTYGNVILNTTQEKDLTPEGVQATSDGGYILLASTDCTTNACVMAQGNTNPIVDWLVKTDSSGNPQWQTEVGCLSAPGSYSIGVSLQQTTDGGYIIGGGGINCGTGGGAIVEKVDSLGNLTWSKTYSIGPNSGGITSIKQTADGGFVAAGGAYKIGPSTGGGLVLKLDASGNLQWQRVVGPMGSVTAIFNAIQQTSDAGYVATGNYYINSSHCQPLQCEGGLVVKLDANGKVQWQQAINPGASASLFTDSIVQTSDGGYAVAGAWFGYTQKGGLLVKLDSSGKIVWQNAYSGGSYYGVELGIVIYSVHQTADGGYFLAGDGEDKLVNDELVPWLGKVDSNGNLTWEYFYYQVYTTGLPLSEYFAGGDVAQDGGFVAAGWTEDYSNGLGLLFLVKTDSFGQCGACGDVHTDAGLTAVNPGLTTSSVSLRVNTTTTPGVSSPTQTKPTALIIKKDC